MLAPGHGMSCIWPCLRLSWFAFPTASAMSTILCAAGEDSVRSFLSLSLEGPPSAALSLSASRCTGMYTLAGAAMLASGSRGSDHPGAAQPTEQIMSQEPLNSA